MRDIPKLVEPSNTLCNQCQHGKQTRPRFKSKDYSTTKSLELNHIDICGPTRTQSLQGENYFMFLIDYYSRMTWITFLKEKYEAFEKFKAFKSLVENENDLKIKCFRLERGGEFISNELKNFVSFME